MSIISKHILREVGVEFLIAVDFCNNTQKVCTLSYVEKRTGRTYSNLCNIAKLFEEEKLNQENNLRWKVNEYQTHRKRKISNKRIKKNKGGIKMTKISTILAFLAFELGSIFIGFLGLLLIFSVMPLIMFTGAFMIVVGTASFLKFTISYDNFLEFCEGE